MAFDLGIKTLATGVTEGGRTYHIGGFKGSRWYNNQLDRLRSKRSKCKCGKERIGARNVDSSWIEMRTVLTTS
ncbi:hypothetical protein KSD_76300 [Ktedonobacter sp. SOSP1-85]|nr:hypothetical protein KSD_76300 [Ktedonobacter sp. SOSP1-85]